VIFDSTYIHLIFTIWPLFHKNQVSNPCIKDFMDNFIILKIILEVFLKSWRFKRSLLKFWLGFTLHQCICVSLQIGFRSMGCVLGNWKINNEIYCILLTFSKALVNVFTMDCYVCSSSFIWKYFMYLLHTLVISFENMVNLGHQA